jgi:hypothetical protein
MGGMAMVSSPKRINRLRSLIERGQFIIKAYEHKREYYNMLGTKTWKRRRSAARQYLRHSS